MCATNPAMNAFVAARLVEGGPAAVASTFGVRNGTRLRAICWVAANVVPVEADDAALDAFASRLRRHRRRCSSIFGDADQVLPLWDRLSRHWGTPRSLRRDQPVLAVSSPPLASGRTMDPRVRPARPDEVDLVLPASAHMFTEEIGYPPYLGSDREYRRLVASLIDRGHTYVIVEHGKVVFKADIGSLASGVAQIQGVWVAPSRRGQGIATPAMNAVVQQILDRHASMVTLYVNGFNEAARRTYAAAGFRQMGTFATVIL
ncbi:GNAT family N-acetyltransferase [Leekyejoonella antrihumi]|uniref:GNAT family N-acetyltransferase n=1 Tax=Leekyejoonella antrihumi TaxID=1660198 RepID=A0A563DXM1_9MICO|nr:GNAT family N-acetyltransferase [Leekyejoonella antrihumi]